MYSFIYNNKECVYVCIQIMKTYFLMFIAYMYISSVQFSRSVMSDSLQPCESQHARPPCPSPTPRVHSNSCPSSRWCHPASSSSVVPFSSCPQSLPASESFPMSQLFAWGGQSIGVSALASVLSYISLVTWSRSVVSDSLQPHGLQPTRLLRPWDSPGKSTGVDRT